MRHHTAVKFFVRSKVTPKNPIFQIYFLKNQRLMLRSDLISQCKDSVFQFNKQINQIKHSRFQKTFIIFAIDTRVTTTT